METVHSDLRTTTPAAQRPRNVRRRDIDPVRIFVDKDRLARFWFLAVVVVLIGAAVERGELRQESDVKLRAQMLFDTYLVNFQPAIFEGWSLEALQARSREQIRILLGAR